MYGKYFYNKRINLKSSTGAVFFIPVVLLLLGGCGYRPGSLPPPIDLSGEWKLIESEDISPSKPDFDDSNAIVQNIPGRVDHILNKYDDYAATVWLRKKVHISSMQRDKLLVLSLHNIGIADETYINGILVGQTGSRDENDRFLSYNFSWQTERNYIFPSSLVNYDGENVIAVKAFYHIIDGVRDRPSLSTYMTWKGNGWIMEYLPSVSNLNPLFLSFLLFMIFSILMKETISPMAMLYAFIFISGGFVISLIMLGFPCFNNNIYRFKFFYFMYAFTDFMMIMFMQEFFNIRLRFCFRAGLVLITGLFVLIAAAPTGRFLINYVGKVTAIVIILYILWALMLFVISLKRDPRRYWYLTIVAAFIIPSTIYTMYALITGRIYLISNSMFIRLPLLIFGAILVYIVDLKNIKLDRDALAKAFLSKSAELQRVRRTITKVDTKPEPKDVIHDLIEFLDENFGETYDRKALAKRFNLNEDYMGQIFKKTTGTNIANYINTRRIEAAKQLLVETRSKVIDIAFHVGFDNLTYFYRHFRRHTGYTPIEYRNCMQTSLPAANDE